MLVICGDVWCLWLIVFTVGDALQCLVLLSCLVEVVFTVGFDGFLV